MAQTEKICGAESCGKVNHRDVQTGDVVDEMLAILSDRNAIIQKKELEHAQATINKVYREGL